MEKKKRVLIVIESLKLGGGAERMTSVLTKRLSNKYDIYILTLKHFKDIYPFNGKYYTLFINSDSNKFLKFKFIRNLYRTYKFYDSISPDLIISVTDYTNLFTIILKLIFRINIPLIAWIHCNPLIAYKDNMRFFISRLKIFYRLKAVNKIVTISEDVKKIIKKHFHIDDIRIKNIYNGIDTEKIYQMSREKIVDSQDIFDDNNLIKFITIGRLEVIKGHKYLINAFYKVKKKLSNSKLIIIGTGSLKNKLKIFVRKNKLEDDVIFLGYRSNPFKYLARSNIFVLSSLTEGLPMVLLEALACEIPIISTNCETGPKEILDDGHYGILARVKDSEDLANKMFELATNKKMLTEYSELSSNRAKFFRLDKFFDEWMKLIEYYI
ncbi:MAG: glycosyltransferase [Promethearchaeota archaeon]